MEGGRDVAAGRKVGALAACLLVLAACSSGGNAAPESTAVLSTTGSTSPATSDAPQTSPPPPETSAPSTSTTSTTTTSTAVTTTPTTLVEPPEAKVRAAVDRAIADFSECLLAMPNCDATTLAATRSDPMLARNVARITEWNAAGYSVIDRDQFRYVIEAVELDDVAGQATVTVCIADGTKLVLADAAPDGSDIIIDDTFVSGREAWDVRRDADGVWRAYDAPA
ncbi:MAG TPA: hypothetical protein PLV68_04260, partial [Ilumatobacteraceae bacterium]|nr:hypothetical protein [Ilumatobacteraceae bacterium]